MCAIALALSAAGTYAQSAGGQGEESKVGRRSQTGQGSETQSKQFVEKMLSANMAEIQLGQLGVQQATSADVKSFAQMMVTDHTKANQELMPLAQQLGVQAPATLDAKHKAIADKLAKLHGAEFDRQGDSTTGAGRRTGGAPALRRFTSTPRVHERDHRA